MQQKLASTQVNIHELLQTRWSPRSFDPDKPVSQEQVLALLEAARWAPSCFNDQPWRFVVCNKTTDANAWQQALATLAEKNQRWAQNAPVLMLVAAMDNFNHNGQPNRWAMYDAGAAIANMCLQATALGLRMHQMGGFDAENARVTFQLPADCKAMAMIAVGYQADIERLDEEFRAAELAERVRKPLQDICFSGQWGKQ